MYVSVVELQTTFLKKQTNYFLTSFSCKTFHLLTLKKSLLQLAKYKKAALCLCLMPLISHVLPHLSTQCCMDQILHVGFNFCKQKVHPWTNKFFVTVPLIISKSVLIITALYFLLGSTTRICASFDRLLALCDCCCTVDVNLYTDDSGKIILLVCAAAVH